MNSFQTIFLFIMVLLFGIVTGSFLNVSSRYPRVDLANGLIWAGLFWRHGLTPEVLCFFAASSSMLVLSVIDWETYEIPLVCNVVIAAAGLVNLIFNMNEWPLYVAGFFSVSLFLHLILLLSGGRAMGGGDVKLMAAAGLLLGWKQCVIAFAAACICGSVFHLLLMKWQGKDRMLAFGPYLSFGIWLSMMWGENLVQWYMRLLLGS